MNDYALIADHGLIGDLPLNDRLDVAAGRAAGTGGAARSLLGRPPRP